MTASGDFEKLATDSVAFKQVWGTVLVGPGKNIDVAKAEGIFTLKGFLTQILPVSAMTYAGVVLACAVAAPTASAGYLLLVLGIPFACVLLGNIWNFNSAKECHFELKTRYGDRYLKMIESGEVSLSGYAVSMMRSPWSHKTVIEKRLG